MWRSNVAVASLLRSSAPPLLSTLVAGYIARPEAFIKRYSTDIIEEGEESGLETDTNFKGERYVTLVTNDATLKFLTRLRLIVALLL